MPPSDPTRSTTRSRIGYTFWTGAGAVAEETVFGRDGDFAITGDEVAASGAVATGVVSFCRAEQFPKKAGDSGAEILYGCLPAGAEERRLELAERGGLSIGRVAAFGKESAGAKYSGADKQTRNADHGYLAGNMAENVFRQKRRGVRQLLRLAEIREFLGARCLGLLAGQLKRFDRQLVDKPRAVDLPADH